MQALMSISDYRRTKQMEYNEKHGITPQTVRRAVQESLHTILRGREIAASVVNEAGGDFNLSELLRELEDEMQQASANLEFERAALLARVGMSASPALGSLIPHNSIGLVCVSAAVGGAYGILTALGPGITWIILQSGSPRSSQPAIRPGRLTRSAAPSWCSAAGFS